MSEASKLRVLVVGAGAVGQVYARHYQLGGADVTMFVREKYQAEARRGFDLYPLNHGVKVVRFEGFGVVTSAAEVKAGSFDQVVLTVASPALRGAWLTELIAAAGDATIVALQPGLDDRAVLLAAGAHETRLVQGLITLISYHAPLEGETRFPTPSMAYWFPPFAAAPFSGPPERTAAVVDALRRGKQPAKRHKDVGKLAGFPTAILMPYLVALELGGWSIKGAVAGGHMALGGRGAREAVAVVQQLLGKPPFGLRALTRPWVLRTAVRLARPFIPLPLETYLGVHFTKVGDQTREYMDGFIAKGKAGGLPVGALVELREKLAAAAAATSQRRAS